MLTPKEVFYHILHGTVGQVQPVGKAEILKAAETLPCERGDWGAKALMIFCDTYTKRYNNINYDPRTNGEYWLMQQLASLDPKIIFDVGANEGEWAFIASKYIHTATIHSFEIVPSTYERFSALTGGRERIMGNNFGLSDEETTVDVNVYEASTGFSSIFEYPQHGEGRKISCPVRKASSYIAEKSIAHVDFLKIDTEGAEPLVLKGFEQYLNDEFIDIIQFEYGTMNSRTQFFLKDFYDLLGAKNFSLGKLYPKGVEFAPYDTADAALFDMYFGPNYVAVSNKRPQIIELLREK